MGARSYTAKEAIHSRVWGIDMGHGSPLAPILAAMREAAKYPMGGRWCTHIKDLLLGSFPATAASMGKAENCRSYGPCRSQHTWSSDTLTCDLDFAVRGAEQLRSAWPKVF